MRTRLGWTPADLAMRAGITAETVRALEHGETTPRTWTIKLLANALSCSAGWLAFGG
jgi:transcriptional regulator with XRE-family HTH domain